MIPAYTAKFSWQEISLHNVTWQQRLEEIRLEAERKAEEERRAEEVRKAEAAARTKRNKKIAMIAAPIALVAVIAGVVIFNNAKSNAKSNAAYNEAVALVQSGEYDEAVAAFEALGNYKDSAEQVQDAKYMRANALLNDKHYADAATAFAELGDYTWPPPNSIPPPVEKAQTTNWLSAPHLFLDTLPEYSAGNFGRH